MKNELNSNLVYTFIFTSCGIGFFYGLLNWNTIRNIDLKAKLPEGDDNRQTITEAHFIKMDNIHFNIKKVSKVNSREPKTFYGRSIFTLPPFLFVFL
jgi:hypothetical protein